MYPLITGCMRKLKNRRVIVLMYMKDTGDQCNIGKIRIIHSIGRRENFVKNIQKILHLSCPQPIYRWFKETFTLRLSYFSYLIFAVKLYVELHSFLCIIEVWVDYVIIYKVGNEHVEIYRVVNRYQDITIIFDYIKIVKLEQEIVCYYLTKDELKSLAGERF